MKARLLRNKPGREGICKYALIRLDKLTDGQTATLVSSQNRKAELATIVLNNLHLIEFGLPGSDDEFFVIKLKDKFSRHALLEYSYKARSDGEDDLAYEVEALSDRSGPRHRECKIPD